MAPKTNQSPQVLEGAAARTYIADLINAQKYKEAEPVLLDVLSRTPDAVIALTALGVVYRSTNRFAASEACYKRALSISPQDAEIYSNYGNLLTDMDRLEEAVECAERAVALKPDSILFRKNLAVTLREFKKFERSLEIYRWCCEQDKQDAPVLLNLAIVCFYLGRYDEAWGYYERRFETKRINFPKLNFPQWQGEPLKGKKLLVVAEQGFGDTILMTRFMPLLREKCDDISLCCKPALHALFSSLPVKLVTEEAVSQKIFDYYLPMMSIPRLIEKNWQSWPSPCALTVPDTARQKFAFIERQKTRLKVGVVWSGSVTFGENAKRSVSLERFHALACAFPQIQFYSFQKGEREADMAVHGQGTLSALGHLFGDFSETAAALQHMDLIVMTDSALAHLAGTLGVPVLNLLNFKPYWLYFPETPDTALYASMRFVRQTQSGNWDEVFETVSLMLGNLVQGQEPKSRQDVLKILDATLQPAREAVAAKSDLNGKDSVKSSLVSKLKKPKSKK